MRSWVYLFSKFTPEALLLEAFIIALLTCIYTAFWILRKRRLGSIKTQLPAGPVKIYLNALIAQAEQLRAQLFGLISAHSQDSTTSSPIYSPQASSNVTPSSLNSEALSALEAKVSEQAQVIETLTAEKNKLSQTHSGKNDSSALNPSQKNSESPEEKAILEEKIKDLENRLLEYSVIEDDLANLKRLQQENALLKNSLSSQGIPLPQAEKQAPETSEASQPIPETQPSKKLSPTTEIPQTPEAREQEDTDLVSEFEKMLKE